MALIRPDADPRHFSVDGGYGRQAGTTFTVLHSGPEFSDAPYSSLPRPFLYLDVLQPLSFILAARRGVSGAFWLSIVGFKLPPAPPEHGPANQSKKRTCNWSLGAHRSRTQCRAMCCISPAWCTAAKRGSRPPRSCGGSSQTPAPTIFAPSRRLRGSIRISNAHAACASGSSPGRVACTSTSRCRSCPSLRVSESGRPHVTTCLAGTSKVLVHMCTRTISLHN